MEEYYNIEEFSEANKEFEEFINSCKIIKDENVGVGDLKISTITSTMPFCENVDLKKIYDNCELNNDLIYIQFGKHNIKGDKRVAKKEPKDSTKKRLSFSNQMSFGLCCDNPEHQHKNPISVKMFKNGSIQMTGSKDIEETEIMYNKLKNSLEKIDCAEKIYDYNIDEMQIEMINGTFNINYKVDLEKTAMFFIDNYDQKEIYINTEKKSPVACYLKKFSYIDERKKKEKTPSVFIYNSGAVNIITSGLDILNNSYNFLKELFDEHYDNIVEKKYVFKKINSKK